MFSLLCLRTLAGIYIYMYMYGFGGGRFGLEIAAPCGWRFGNPVMWHFPKIRVAFLGVPIIIRTIAFWGLYWGPLILGDYHVGFTTLQCA